MPAPFTEREDLDFSILWEWDEPRLRRYARAGRLPSHVFPKHAKRPGALVAIASSSGTVLWVFTLAAVVPRKGIRAANGGSIENGFVLISKEGKFRRPSKDDPARVAVNPYSAGALKYFDNSTGQDYTVTKSTNGHEPIKTIAGEFPEELDPKLSYADGAKKRVLVNRYERDAKARAACIDHYGTCCAVCKINFSLTYGRIGDGFIHVHHIKPLASRGRERKLDPIKDLRPVCPNCHAMLHRGGKVRSIASLRKIIRAAD
jgi:hypothetical protein